MNSYQILLLFQVVLKGLHHTVVITYTKSCGGPNVTQLSSTQ